MSWLTDGLAREFKKLLCKEVLVYLVGVPLLAVTVFGYLYHLRVGREYPIVVVDEERSAVSRLAEFYLDSAPELRVIRVLNTLEEGRQAMVDGEAQAMVYLRRGLYRNVLHKHVQTAMVIVDGRNLVKVNSLLTGIARTLGTARIGAELKLMDKYFPVPDRLDKLRPLTVVSRPMGNPSVDYFLFVITALMVLALWQGTLVGSSLGIARERDMGTWNRTLEDAGGLWRLIISRNLAVLALALPTTTAVAAVFYGLFNAPMMDPPGALVMLWLYTAALVHLAGFAGVFFRHSVAVLQFFFFTTLPAFFLSGYPFPRESLHPFIRALAALLPSTPVLNALPRLNTIAGSRPYLSGAYLHLMILCLGFLFLQVATTWLFFRREKPTAV